MKHKLVNTLFILALVLSLAPAAPAVLAATLTKVPDNLPAPADFAASTYGLASDESTVDKFLIGYTLPQVYRDISDSYDAIVESMNISEMNVRLEADYKLNENGTWQSESSSGNLELYEDVVNFAATEEAYFPPDWLTAVPNAGSVSWLKNNTIYFRIRLAVIYTDLNNDSVVKLISPWSNLSSVGKSTGELNPDVIAPPVLTSAKAEKDQNGAPYFALANTIPETVKALHNTAADIRIAIEYNIDGGQWIKYSGMPNLTESFDVKITSGGGSDVRAGKYGFRLRYECTRPSAEVKFSGYSNELYTTVGAYSAASSWAAPELDKAAEYGLVPDILTGADMTKPITREEFAEMAVQLYERTTGKAPAPASPNPFKDTANPQILKAFKLGITTGVTPATFAPKELTNREQVATMLSRAIRVMVPDGDFSTAGAPVFTDQKEVGSWALEHVLFMSKLGIIKGVDGKFMPRAVTTAQKASGYATTTREQAIAMGVRAYESVSNAGGTLAFQSSTSSTPTANTPAANTPTANTPAANTPAASTPEASTPEANTPAASADAGAQAGQITGNELLLINDTRFIKGEYVVKAGGDNTFIFIPLEMFKYAFRLPYAGNNSVPIVQKTDGKIRMKWKNAENEVYLTVDLEVGKPRAFINGSDVDIIEAPYEGGEDIMIPVNIFVELFKMEAEFFQSILCLQNKQDFPADILVGTWSRSQTNVLSGYQDILTGAVSLPSYATNWKFSRDGTYRLAMVSGGTYDDTFLLQKGKYKIIGNTVIRYEVLETIYRGNPFQLGYKDRQMNFRGGPYVTVFIADYNAGNGKIKLDWDWFNRLETED